MSSNISKAAFVFAFDRAICRLFCDVLMGIYSPINTFAPPPTLYLRPNPFEIPTPSSRALELIRRDLTAELKDPKEPYAFCAIQVDSLDILLLDELTVATMNDARRYWYSNNPAVVTKNDKMNQKIYGTKELLSLLNCERTHLN